MTCIYIYIYASALSLLLVPMAFRPLADLPRTSAMQVNHTFWHVSKHTHTHMILQGSSTAVQEKSSAIKRLGILRRRSRGRKRSRKLEKENKRKLTSH